ncbi:MAG: ribonuclease HII [Reyranella sp.]|uniref:ribonuclease HII n=1 Tax=Reyranella sp. TaxID=1929291 RepID=UPI003D146B87
MPSFRFERDCAGRVAGIDEAGRGPLAGPVVAAVAVIDRAVAKRKLLRLIDDSKKLEEEAREMAYDAMVASGIVQFAVGEASVEEIDRVNILQATYLAMRRALQALAAAPGMVPPDMVLIDGDRVPPALGCSAQTIVGGDARSYSIAAASIFAKVTRDRYMAQLAEEFPGYGWETNRGYGSREHLEAIDRLGPTPHHRMSFAPLKLRASGLPLLDYVDKVGDDGG